MSNTNITDLPEDGQLDFNNEQCKHGQTVANSLLCNWYATSKGTDVFRHLLEKQKREQVYKLENKPPGLAGDLTQAIFDASYLPASEIAIAATLGLLAAVCGRAYETPTGKDCGLYIILVAQSGQGKDAIHDGIPAMLRLLENHDHMKCIRQTDFASGPALHKALLAEPGFLAMQGEMGRKLKGMATMGNTPMQELRTVLTNAYGKETLDGKAYADKEKSLNRVRRPALSFIGETTPGTFSDSLTPDMMEDGFLSRFNIITYKGKRPRPNKRSGTYTLSPESLSKWKKVFNVSIGYVGTHNPPPFIRVGYRNDEVKERLENFENECGDSINATNDESERQVYNRAALKAYKVASLLAIADNHEKPQIRIGHAEWAVCLIKKDIKSFILSKESGDIGMDDTTRFKKLESVLVQYLKGKVPPSYKVNPKMLEDGAVPRSYLQMRTGQVRCFKNYRMGETMGLNHTIQTAIDSGYLMEIPKEKVFDKYQYHGKAYYILEFSFEL